MQVTKITIDYQANYNGCTVIVNEEFDAYDFHKTNPDLEKKMVKLQDDVVNKAYDDCIKSGRREGEFNGDFDELEGFAITAARAIFGDEVEVDVSIDEDSN